MNMKRHIGITVIAVSVIAGTAGVAQAASEPGARRTPAAVAADKPARTPLVSPAQREQLRGKGHVDVSKKTRRGTVTLAVQRGQITAVSATSITIRSKDGYTHTYAIKPATKIRERRSPIAIADLKVGQRAAVVARHTATGDTARVIRRLPAAAPKI